MNKRSHIHKKADSSASNPVQSQLQSRPFIAQAQPQSSKPISKTETETQEFQQHNSEATKLKLQAKYGTITPEGQERLTVLQAKMSSSLQRKLEHASSNGSNFANIPISPPDASLQQAVQTKLTIGEPGDKYEQEADRVAAQVVKQINAPVSQQIGQSQPVQREEVSEEEDELQMKPMLKLRSAKVGMTTAPEVETSIQQARGGGQPLADSIREPMEQAFGADFTGVKVHTDSRADQLNQSIQAKAFATGQDVFFRQGEYNPGSRGGQELIAHELTHVVQQNGGAVAQRQKEIIQPNRLYPNAGSQKNIIDIKTATGQIQRADTPETTGSNIDIARVRQEYDANTHALKLLENITNEMSDTEKIAQLIRNICERPFNYTGAARRDIFRGEGNCGTLSREFVEIGEKILSQRGDIQYRNGNNWFLVRRGGEIIGDEKTGNTDHGTHWIFQSHAWVEYQGEVIDVLFKGRRGKHWTLGDKQRGEYLFEDEIYYRVPELSPANENHIYTSEKPTIAKEQSSGNNTDSKPGQWDRFKGKAKDFKTKFTSSTSKK